MAEAFFYNVYMPLWFKKNALQISEGHFARIF
jgi:hypothetical protein